MLDLPGTPSPLARQVEIWTVGHSDRTAAELLALLQAAGVEFVIDVRAAPWSRRTPWHARAELEQSLGLAGIGYQWMGAALGGCADGDFAARRGAEGYGPALEELLSLASRRRTALLCAERDPRHCHRLTIAEDLSRRGVVVRHLIDAGWTEGHQSPLLFGE